VTNSELPTAEADITHRRHAIIETTFADLIDGPLAHIPSVILSRCHWQGPDLLRCVVDGVFKVATGWVGSAWSDEFFGLSSGRVAAGGQAQKTICPCGAEGFGEGVAEFPVVFVELAHPFGGRFQAA
jgi:hypothetical protein